MTSTTGRHTKGPPLPERLAPDVAELHAAGHGRNEIARRLKCSPSTVTKAAALAGVAFDGTATDAATVARVRQASAARAELAGMAAEIAATSGRRLLVEFRAVLIDVDVARIANAAFGTSVDKLAILARLDSELGDEQAENDAKAALNDLVGAIRASVAPDHVAAAPTA